MTSMVMSGRHARHRPPREIELSEALLAGVLERCIERVQAGSRPAELPREYRGAEKQIAPLLDVASLLVEQSRRVQALVA
jgi:hypothetical protein